jgi:hypothetical protein
VSKTPGEALVIQVVEKSFVTLDHLAMYLQIMIIPSLVLNNLDSYCFTKNEFFGKEENMKKGLG